MRWRHQASKLEGAMSADEHRAMLELQMELAARTTGRLPVISADEVIELRGFLAAHPGDLRSLIAPAYE